METPLTICLFGIFIASGASLQCEICEDLGHSCNGTMKTCPHGMDRCGIVLSETTGIQIKAVMKICTPSISCNDGRSVINIGHRRTTTSQIFCCVGDECGRFNPSLSPIKTKPNGKVCPACYSVNQLDCEEEEEIQCSGDENNCLQTSGTANMGELAVKIIMKGCANDVACTQLNEQVGSFSGIKIVASKSCTPASSKASRSIPGLFGLLLPALAGLLVITVFL